MKLKNDEKQFIVNSLITLKLQQNVKTGVLETMIFINGKAFRQCKYLLLVDPNNWIRGNNFNSIDEASEKLNNALEEDLVPEDIGITAEQEFLAHCSNLQAWAEHNYDTRLIHSNLAFPLLKKLSEAGDSLARSIFNTEIAKRFIEGPESVRIFLTNEDYLTFLDQDELSALIKHPKILKDPMEYDIVRTIERIININLEINLCRDPFSLNGIGIVDKKIVGFRLHQDKLDSIKEAELFQYIYMLNNLEFFEAHLELAKIPENLSTLKNLKLLNMSSNKLKKCIEIKDLPNLKRIYLDNNIIEQIELKNLPKLEKISIRENNLYRLVFNETPKLKEVGLLGNKIRDLTPLLQLPNLKLVTLSSNKDDLSIQKLKNKKVKVYAK